MLIRLKAYYGLHPAALPYIPERGGMFPVKTAGVVKLIKRLMIMPGQITNHAHTLIFIQIRKHAVKELVTAAACKENIMHSI